MANTLQIKRGTKSNIPTLNQAELFFATDESSLYVGDGSSNHGIAMSSDLTSHTDSTSNPHSVTASQVGLGNVPNTNIAYSSTIAADAFTSTEVSNLRAAKLDDGTTPWTSNNYFDTGDVDSHLSGGAGITYSTGTITNSDTGSDAVNSHESTYNHDNFVINVVKTKSGAYTLSSGELIHADTSGGAFTLSCPPSPTDGDVIGIIDKASNFATNNLTLDGNGNTILGDSTFIFDVSNQPVEFVYNSNRGEWIFSKR